MRRIEFSVETREAKLEIGIEGEEFFVASKPTKTGIFILIFAICVAGGLIGACLFVAFIAVRGVMQGAGSLGQGSLLCLFLAACATPAVLALREALWVVLPKKLIAQRSTGKCRVINYGVLNSEFQCDEVEFVGLKVGAASGGRGHYNRLYVYMRSGTKCFRIASTASNARSHHAAFSSGVEAGRLIVEHLGTSLKYDKNGWVKC